MFDSFSALSNTPTDSAARAQTFSSLQNFASTVNDIYAGLDSIQADANTRLHTQIDEVNSLAARVAEINTFSRTPGGLPADLNDELQTTLDKLSSLVGATAQTQSDGRVRVTINGWALVDADRPVPLTVPDSPVGTVLHPSGPITLGGSVGGLQEAISGDVEQLRTKLNDFVDGFITQINDLHNTGFTPDGTSGGDLLELTGGRVNVTIADADSLAASPDPTGPLGNGVADSLAQLRNSVAGDYRDVVTTVANQVASLNRSAATSQAVSNAAVAVRDSVVGVNLDEEMTNMMTEQRAYQAAARVISVVDEMMNTLLNM